MCVYILQCANREWDLNQDAARIAGAQALLLPGAHVAAAAAEGGVPVPAAPGDVPGGEPGVRETPVPHLRVLPGDVLRRGAAGRAPVQPAVAVVLAADHHEAVPVHLPGVPGGEQPATDGEGREGDGGGDRDRGRPAGTGMGGDEGAGPAAGDGVRDEAECVYGEGAGAGEVEEAGAERAGVRGGDVVGGVPGVQGGRAAAGAVRRGVRRRAGGRPAGAPAREPGRRHAAGRQGVRVRGGPHRPRGSLAGLRRLPEGGVALRGVDPGQHQAPRLRQRHGAGLGHLPLQDAGAGVGVGVVVDQVVVDQVGVECGGGDRQTEETAGAAEVEDAGPGARGGRGQPEAAEHAAHPHQGPPGDELRAAQAQPEEEEHPRLPRVLHQRTRHQAQGLPEEARHLLPGARPAVPPGRGAQEAAQVREAGIAQPQQPDRRIRQGALRHAEQDQGGNPLEGAEAGRAHPPQVDEALRREEPRQGESVTLNQLLCLHCKMKPREILQKPCQHLLYCEPCFLRHYHRKQAHCPIFPEEQIISKNYKKVQLIL